VAELITATWKDVIGMWGTIFIDALQ